MRKFLQRALDRIDKMDRQQVRRLVGDIAAENELLEIVMESMSDGVVVTDTQDRVLLINKSAERMLPFEGEDIQDRPLWESIRDKEIGEFFRQSLQGLDRIVDREFTLDSGYLRTLALSLMPLVREGSIVGNVIHIEDVTDRRAKEARLRRAESLAALTTLTAGVAHEIKNPLASMGIYLELMRKELSGRDSIETGRVLENLVIIKEELDRLNRIVVDFLFTVRPMNAELEYGNLNAVVRELVDFIRLELDAAGIGLELQLDERAPEILMDPRYVKQAVLNIIKNGISAMPDGGTLSVRTERRAGRLRLSIADTGVGIPEENLDKIFEPYFTTKDFGSGLGLTIVYKIVKEHMGEVEVSSKPGEGTTFTLSFPVPQKEKRLIAYSEEERR